MFASCRMCLGFVPSTNKSTCQAYRGHHMVQQDSDRAPTNAHVIWLVNSASSPFLTNAVIFSGLIPPPSVNFILSQNWLNPWLFRFASASSPGSVPLHRPQKAPIV
ncbi:hypothetical protein TRVL_08443 [Trypanosoma vivax]|nr:hypothetical protein TRVL_08443 [Trypanosoma vivax]